MSGLKLVGEDVTAEPNYPSCLVSSIGQAAAFSQNIGFLTHAVFAMGVHKGEPNVLKGAYKGLMTTEELEAATRIVLKQHGAAHVKSDMRTHVNPTRLQAVKRAAETWCAGPCALRTVGLRRRRTTRGTSLWGVRDADAPGSAGNRRLHRLRFPRRTCPGHRTGTGVAG